MKRTFQCGLFIILILALFSSPFPAHADIAPPGHPPGSNLQPGDAGTQVRMVAETVVIAVQADTPADSLGRARVTADFTMRNMGVQAESMAVRFPISTNDGSFNYPEITDLVVKMDGKTVHTRQVSYDNPPNYSEKLPWAEFDVTFPPGQDVAVHLSYSLEGTGEDPYIAFYYILETGAGWYDTIGTADIILRMPYEANPQNVILETQIGWSETTPGGVLSGNDVRWHYDNLEPARENNIEISLVMPSVWKKVLNELNNVAKHPNDGEAWGRLGKLYKEVFFLRKGFREDAGALELYDLSVQAYEKALALLPNDALWHAGFADLLYNHYYWGNRWQNPANNADLLRALQEINQALAIRPNDPKVIEIADNMYYSFPEAIQKTDTGYIFLWLTATPVYLTPTAELAPAAPTDTPPAVTSQLPPQTTTPGAQPVKPSSPVCGTLLLVPLGMGLVAARKKKVR